MTGGWTRIFPWALIALFLVSRLPGFDTKGFSLAYALCFCAGAFPRRLNLLAVAAAIVASDLWLNIYYGAGLISDWQAVNYVGYTGIWLLGRQLRERRSPVRFLFTGLLGALLFYILSNTAAWLGTPQYVKSFAGWWQAITTGLPGWPPTWTFFRNTMISGGLFTAVIGTLLNALQAVEPETDEAEETEEAPDAEEHKEPAKA
jgi:hypothetical protein